MTSVSQFQGRFSLQEQFDDINARGVRGPVQTAYSVRHRVRFDTRAQQKLDHIGSAIFAGPCKTAFHLLLRRAGSQSSVLPEEIFDQVDPSHSGRSLKIQGSPSFGKMLRCFAATVRQAGVNESLTV